MRDVGLSVKMAREVEKVLTTIEAEIDVAGNVRLLEPVKVKKTSRAILTVLDDEGLVYPKATSKILDPSYESVDVAAVEAEKERRRLQMEWLKANRKEYGGQYVILDGANLLGVAKNYPAGRQIAKQANVPQAFVVYLSKPDESGYLGGWE